MQRQAADFSQRVIAEVSGDLRGGFKRRRAFIAAIGEALPAHLR
jgi:hypothetical protein